MKLLLLLAAVGVAFGDPKIVESLLKKGVVTEKILQTPMISLTYEELVPVVKETTTMFLKTTIPEGCQKVTVPYMSIGLIRTHCIHILRDVLLLLEGSTVEDKVVLESLRIPFSSPADKQLKELNTILMRIRERISLYKGHPINFGVPHVTPAILVQLEVYDAIASLYLEQLDIITSTIKIKDTVPFEKLLFTMTTGTLGLNSYMGKITLREWVSEVIAEMKAATVPVTPEMCQSEVPLPKLLSTIEEFLNKIEKLDADSVISRLSKAVIPDMTFVKELLVKVLPVLKDNSPIVRLAKVLKSANVEIEFVPYVTNFTAERFVMPTFSYISTESVVSELLDKNVEMLAPTVERMKLAMKNGETATTEFLKKLVAKFAVVVRSRGLPLVDCVDMVFETLKMPAPEKLKSMNPHSWEESMEVNSAKPDAAVFNAYPSMESTKDMRAAIKKLVDDVLEELD